jgi:hypothetical protein
MQFVPHRKHNTSPLCSQELWPLNHRGGSCYRDSCTFFFGIRTWCYSYRNSVAKKIKRGSKNTETKWPTLSTQLLLKQKETLASRGKDSLRNPGLGVTRGAATLSPVDGATPPPPSQRTGRVYTTLHTALSSQCKWLLWTRSIGHIKMRLIEEYENTQAIVCWTHSEQQWH